MDSHKVAGPRKRKSDLHHPSPSLFTWWWDQYFVGEAGGKLDVLSESRATWKKCRLSKWLKLSQGMWPTVVCAGDGWGSWKRSFTSNTWARYQSNPKQPSSLRQRETHPCRPGFKCQRVTHTLIKIPNVSQEVAAVQSTLHLWSSLILPSEPASDTRICQGKIRDDPAGQKCTVWTRGGRRAPGNEEFGGQK